MNARILLNPASGRRRGARWRERLEALGRSAGVEVVVTESPDDLVERARRAAADGIERLLVAGGDGTYHLAAQGLARSDTALAPIALGTGNDLARELRLSLDPARAVAQALEGPIDRIDLGRIDGRYFCGVAGIGFDAAVAERARRVRWLRGPAVYAFATLACLARYAAPRIRLETESGTLEGRAFFVVFANTGHYGGGMRIAPDADPADGLLDVVWVDRVSKWELLRLFPRVYRGGHVGHPAVRITRTAGARLQVDRSQFVNADGEGLGTVDESGLEVGLERLALAVVRSG